MEKTFSIIKPDATKRNITGSINKIIEEDKTEYKNKEIIMKLFNRFIYEEQPQEFLTTRSYQFIN